MQQWPYVGDCPQWISPEENDFRVFIHGVVEADHEKDFHSVAAFPHESHRDLALYVWRISRGGALTLESLVGAAFQTNRARPKVAHALVHKGHMRLLVPPPEYTHRQWLQQVAAHHVPPLETPCFGWGSILLQSASSVPTTPGDVVAKCQRCKANSATTTGDSRVGRLAEDPAWRTLSTWGFKAWDALPTKSSCAPRARLDLSGRDAKCIEIFAGTGRVTQSWLDTGALADDPVELFADPLSRKGPRPEHDVLRPEVQRTLLAKARSAGTSRPTHWFIEFPCGSFCDWQLRSAWGHTHIPRPRRPPGWPSMGTRWHQARHLRCLLVHMAQQPTPETSSSRKTPRRPTATRQRSTSHAGSVSCDAATPWSFQWTYVDTAAAQSMPRSNATASVPGPSQTIPHCPH